MLILSSRQGTVTKLYVTNIVRIVRVEYERWRACEKWMMKRELLSGRKISRYYKCADLVQQTLEDTQR